MVEELNKCSIKSLVLLNVSREGEGKEDEGRLRSGVGFIDLSFHRLGSVTLDHITLKNNYTFKIMATSHSPASSNWQIVFPWRQIMKSPHQEDDAENEVLLDNLINVKGVTNLRLHLQQPSPLWLKFGVEKITCFGVKEKENKK